MKFRMIILLALLLVVMRGYGTVKTDSLKLNFLQNNDFIYDKNYNIKFVEAAYYIKEDSVRKGLKLLSQGFANGNNVDHIYRVADYSFLELANFLELIDKDELSATEDTVFMHFFTRLFKKRDMNFKPVLKLIPRKERQKELYLRLEILCAYLQDDYPEVNGLLKKWLEINHNSLEGNILKAYLLYKSKDYTVSIGYFHKVLKLYPHYAYGYYLRGRCYEELEQNDKADTDYLKALELYPRFPTALNEYGLQCYDKKEMSKAISYFKKAIEISPYFQWPYNNAGLAYARLNQRDSALYYLEKAIMLNPSDRKAYNNRGDVYYDNNQYEEAIKDYTKSIQLSPRNWYYYADRGDAYFYSEDYEKAEADFQKAFSLKPGYYYAIGRVGDCYYIRKDYKKAIHYANLALKVEPKYYFARFLKAMSYMRMEKYDAAITAYKELIEQDPKMPTAYGNLGWTYYCTGDYTACIQYSKKAIELDEDAFYAKFNMALSYLRLGVMDEAKRLYTQYYEESLSKKEDISGAVSDLEDLVNQNIKKEDAEYILKNILKR